MPFLSAYHFGSSRQAYANLYAVDGLALGLPEICWTLFWINFATYKTALRPPDTSQLLQRIHLSRLPAT